MSIGMGDFDGDGIPDIYDTDDDNDTIPTSVELQYHLDPFNPADANGDLDHDGLNKSFEYHRGLNIQNLNTDHDRITTGGGANFRTENLKISELYW